MAKTESAEGPRAWCWGRPLERLDEWVVENFSADRRSGGSVCFYRVGYGVVWGPGEGWRSPDEYHLYLRETAVWGCVAGLQWLSDSLDASCTGHCWNAPYDFDGHRSGVTLLRDEQVIGRAWRLSAVTAAIIGAWTRTLIRGRQPWLQLVRLPAFKLSWSRASVQYVPTCNVPTHKGNIKETL